MSKTTRLIRENSVVIVDSHIPEGMTVADYRRSRTGRGRVAARRRLRMGSKVRSSSTV